MFRFLLRLSTLLVVILGSTHAYSEIYRWVDDSGKVQFSDRPVASNSKPVEIDTSKNVYGGGKVMHRQQDLLDRYQKQDNQDQKNRQQVKREKAKQEQRNLACVRAKDKLARFEGSTLYTLDAQGERTYFSEEKRTQAIKEFRKSINKHC